MKAFSIVIILLCMPVLCSSLTFGDEATEKKLSLSNVIELVIKNHPEIEGLKAKSAQTEARRQAGPFIPPPMVSLGTMGDRGPFSGTMERSIELSQTIPFPTKLIAESRERSLGQKTDETQLEARTLALKTEAKSTFFELYRARGKISLLEEKRRALDSHAKRIRSITLSDRIVQAHLIRIQTEIELSQNEIEKAYQKELVSKGALNLVMGLDPVTPVPILEAPPLSDLPKSIETAQLGQHPQLRAIHTQSDVLSARVDRANAEWLPDFTVKYRYNRRYDGLMPNNSEIMVGVDLPFLFFWQPQGRIAEARAQSDEIRSQARQTENELKLKLLKTRSEAESMRTRLISFKDRIIPQTERRMKIAHSTAPTDMESLNEHRESIESHIELQLAAFDLRVDYEKAVSELEAILQNTDHKN